MKIWIDTEFSARTEVTRRGVERHVLDLISLGAVREDGAEFYAVSADFQAREVSSWVAANVLPQLGDGPRIGQRQMAATFSSFVGTARPEFWSLVAAQDWFLIMQLFGGYEGLPRHWPVVCWDLYQWAFSLGASEVYPRLNEGRFAPEPGAVGKHHALVDARMHRDIHRYLDSLATNR